MQSIRNDIEREKKMTQTKERLSQVWDKFVRWLRKGEESLMILIVVSIALYIYIYYLITKDFISYK